MSGGLERARGHLAAAVAELEAACRAWGVWADEVRERAEQRLGTGPADPRVCREPEYARALDAGRPFTEAARAAAVALRASCEAAGACAASWPRGPGNGNRFTSFLIAANDTGRGEPMRVVRIAPARQLALFAGQDGCAGPVAGAAGGKPGCRCSACWPG